MARTYVQLTRQEFEDWLDSIGFRGKWKIKAGRGGVYQLHLSQYVAIDINSTTGTQEEVMGHGQASMKLRLVSRVSGRTLNKKAMGQGHFKRTIGWKKTWKKGVDRMKDAYLKSASWYDNIARVENRDKYKADMLAKIEANPNWASNDFLSDLHSRVNKGNILSLNQEKALSSKRSEPDDKRPAAKPEDDPYLVRLRNLWSAARRAGDSWVMDFVKNNANKYKKGLTLSPKVQAILEEKFRQFRVREAAARVADQWMSS